MSYSIVGKSVAQRDALDKVMGRTKYVDDIELPDMLHAKLLRSKYPHARLLKVDTREAERATGVRAVITAKDVPANKWGTYYEPPVFADEKVRFIGEPVAAVAAESLAEAEDALELIDVQYEELPSVFHPKRALEPDAPKVHETGNLSFRRKIVCGDVQSGFSQADEIIEDEFSTQKVQHCSLEPHGAIASVDASQKLAVWTSPGSFWRVYSNLLVALKIPAAKLRFIQTAQGGGFGGKNYMSVEPYVSLLAMKTKKPVKMIWTREEEFTTAATRHNCRLSYRTGVKKDGRMVAREIAITYDSGAYTVMGPRILEKGAVFSYGPYRIPNVKVEACLVHTNKAPAGAMRGFGAPQVIFAEEVHTDNIAARLGIDPLKLRLKNVFKAGDRTATGAVLHSVGISETILKASQAAGWNLQESQT
jgi:CO/xanthine dehydrogenase Mo-binding subunit